MSEIIKSIIMVILLCAIVVALIVILWSTDVEDTANTVCEYLGYKGAYKVGGLGIKMDDYDCVVLVPMELSNDQP